MVKLGGTKKSFWGCLLVLFLVGFWGAKSGHAASWSQTYGGTEDEQAHSIQISTDDYSFAGSTTLIDGGFEFSKAWAVKLTQGGDVLWQRTFTGAWSDWFSSIQASSDGQVAAGATFFFPERSLDGWVVKFDNTGNVIWQKAYGGDGVDRFESIIPTPDGYVVAGSTGSFRPGFRDAWVAKLDADGDVLWQRSYGRQKGLTSFSTIQPTSDGYIAVGGTRAGFFYDGWVVKLDSEGNIEWQKALGGENDDFFVAVQPVTDGYVVAGSTFNSISMLEDGLVIKLDLNGEVLWQKTYGGEDTDGFTAIAPMGDSYVAAGRLGFDGVVVKIDADGDLQWQQTYGGERTDTFASVHAKAGGFVVAGLTESFGVSQSDIRHGWNAWVLELDSSGRISDCPIGGISDGIWNDMPGTANEIALEITDPTAPSVATDAIVIDSQAITTTECSNAPDPGCNCNDPDAIVGTSGPDTLFGTTGDDIICGLEGNDSIFGQGGNDCIDGGPGNDNLLGDSWFSFSRGGADRIFGGNGNDNIIAGPGNDAAFGGEGNDNINGGSGDDVIDGGDGVDNLSGGRGDDTCSDAESVNSCEP